jgi:hypothetical protein
MEKDPLTRRMESIRRRGGTPTLVEGKLVIEWPTKTRATVGINKVNQGTGKKAAHDHI